MLQNYKTYHLKKGKKTWEQLENVPGKESYQGGYVNIKLFLILILAVDKTDNP